MADRKYCQSCRGMGFHCCGDVIPATYWQPSECCGRNEDERCEDCGGSGIEREPQEGHAQVRVEEPKA